MGILAQSEALRSRRYEGVRKLIKKKTRTLLTIYLNILSRNPFHIFKFKEMVMTDAYGGFLSSKNIYCSAVVKVFDSAVMTVLLPNSFKQLN